MIGLASNLNALQHRSRAQTVQGDQQEPVETLNASVAIQSNQVAEIKITPQLTIPFVVEDGPVDATELSNACAFWLHLAHASGCRLIEERRQVTLYFNVPEKVFQEAHPIATWSRCIRWFAMHVECDPFEVTLQLYRYFGWSEHVLEDLAP